MRLITRKIWRAFPELDRFTDEQCRGFVKAAQRRVLSRVVRFVVCVATGGLAGFGVWFGIMFWAIREQVSSRMRPVSFDKFADWELFAAPVLGLVVAFFVGMVLRDRMIRRSIRNTIDRRGTCGGCKYVLLGLRVGQNLKVVCPECGKVSDVDPSLNELASSEGGVATFQPTIRFTDPAVAARNAARWKRRRKWILVAAALVFVATAGWLGMREYGLRAQSELAGKSRNFARAMQSLAESTYVKEIETAADNEWGRFASLVGEHDMVITAILAEVAEFEGVSRGDIDFEVICSTAEEYEIPDGRPPFEEQVVRAIRMIEEMTARGVFLNSHRLTQIRMAVRSFALAPGEPAISLLLPELSATRRLSRLNGVRMELAVRQQNEADFFDAFEQILATSEILGHQPLAIDRLVGLAITSLGIARLGESLSRMPAEQWLDRAESLLRTRSAMPPIQMVIDGEMETSKDSVYWVFEERWKASQRIGLLEDWRETGFPAGNMKENIDALDAHGTYWKKAAAMPFPMWHTLGKAPVVGVRPASDFVSAIEKVVQQDVAAVARWRGALVLVALERAKRRTGEYPATLGDVPEITDFVDPFSGDPLRYVRFDSKGRSGGRSGGGPAGTSGPNPSENSRGRAFLLYSVGVDGVDDVGPRIEAGTFELGNNMTNDIIINDW